MTTGADWSGWRMQAAFSPIAKDNALNRFLVNAVIAEIS
jgi:hypothetical protein